MNSSLGYGASSGGYGINSFLQKNYFHKATYLNEDSLGESKILMKKIKHLHDIMWKN